MSSSSLPASQGLIVAIHLLDSAKGHSVQSWNFSGRDELRIGRLDDNDVVLTDPAVSRLHAILRCNGAEWNLESFGKHGVLVDDRRVETCPLSQTTVFRLGANGPTLMFERTVAAGDSSQQCSKTVEFDSFVVGELGFNRDLAAEQVRKITDDGNFKRLLEQAAELKKKRSSSND